MKTGEDFRREFPPTDEGFQDAAYRALQGLHEKEEERRMRFRPMIVITLLLVLLTGVGVAATWERWSLDDFFTSGRITATEDEWRAMVDDFEPVTVQNELAEVTVREALFDGYALYIVADVVPQRSGDFFMPEMTKLGSPASEAAESLPSDMTVQEYMSIHGYTRAFEVSMRTGIAGTTFLPEMEINEDGTMTFYLRQRMQQNSQLADVMDVTLYMPMHIDGVGRFYSVEVPLTIQRLPVLEEAVSRNGDRHEFGGIGVAMSNLHLIRTPISTYVTVDAEIMNEESFSSYFGNYTLSFVSADGDEYDAGPFNLSGFMRDSKGRDAEPGELYYMATLTLNKIPDRLVLNEAAWGVLDPVQANDSWLILLEKVD